MADEERIEPTLDPNAAAPAAGPATPANGEKPQEAEKPKSKKMLFIIIGVVVWLRPAPVAAPSAGPALATLASVQTIMAQRCVSCHGEQVQMKNIRLDSPDTLRQHAQNVYLQVVVTRQMPMNNATGITEEERATIGRWFQAVAKAD